eukprot:GILJ01000365.1.p1 GENE.GILJ01000365.1~~GILJ01000365.1.p1  ORF type:complete len:588 (-),score=52.82 GILJ01000365.1:168-1901(-)
METRVLLVLLLVVCLCADAAYPPGACRSEEKQDTMLGCVRNGAWYCEWCDLSALDPQSVDLTKGTDFENEVSGSAEKFVDTYGAPSGFPFRCARRWTPATCPGRIYRLGETTCEEKRAAIDEEQEFVNELEGSTKQWADKGVVQTPSEARSNNDLKKRLNGLIMKFKYSCTEDAKDVKRTEKEIEVLARKPEDLVGKEEVTPGDDKSYIIASDAKDRFVKPFLKEKKDQPFPVQVCSQWDGEPNCYIAGCVWCKDNGKCRPSWTEDQCRGTTNTRDVPMKKSPSFSMVFGGVSVSVSTTSDGLAGAAWKYFEEHGWYPMPGADVNKIQAMESIARADKAAAEESNTANNKYTGGGAVMVDKCTAKSTLFACLADERDGCSWCLDPIPLTAKDSTNQVERIAGEMKVARSKAKCGYHLERNSQAPCYSAPLVNEAVIPDMEAMFKDAYKDGFPADPTDEVIEAQRKAFLEARRAPLGRRGGRANKFQQLVNAGKAKVVGGTSNVATRPATSGGSEGSGIDKPKLVLPRLPEHQLQKGEQVPQSLPTTQTGATTHRTGAAAHRTGATTHRPKPRHRTDG